MLKPGFWGRLFGAVGIAALAACDEAPSTVKEYARNDPWSHALHASAKGPILVRVFNNPFAVDDTDLAARVTARFAAAINSRKMTYTTDAGAAPQGRKFHVVVAFNPPKDALGSHVCRGEDLVAGAPPANGRLEVLGAVCVEGELWVQVRGQAPDVAEPEGTMWDMLMGQVIRDLFGQV